MTDTAIRDGHRAESELRQTEAAFAAVQKAAVDALIRTSSGEQDKRERLIVTCQIIDAVRAALIQTVANGQHAEAAAEALAQQNLLRR